jgi:hypothetical protein
MLWKRVVQLEIMTKSGTKPSNGKRGTPRRRIALTVLGGVLLVLLGASLVVAMMLYARSQARNQRQEKRQAKALVSEANPLMGEVTSGGITGEPLPPATPDPEATDIVLVVVDTVRRDALRAYGASHETSPFFDSVAADGILFTRAFSVSSWTTPAMFSMMTGVYPSEHGVVSGTALGEGLSRRVKGQETLPDEAITLAERLKAAGYATFGINTNFHMHPKFGFAQGFDRYAGESFAFLPYPNLMVEAFAPEIGRTAKHFVWLHYFDPHFPYRAVAPHFDRWNDSHFATPMDFSADIVRRFYYAYGRKNPKEPVDLATSRRSTARPSWSPPTRTRSPPPSATWARTLLLTTTAVSSTPPTSARCAGPTTRWRRPSRRWAWTKRRC